jgi:hypothetical protein
MGHAATLWNAREQKCLATLERALAKLRDTKNLPESETELNRVLYFCLLAASRELYADDEVAPVPECNNQPDPDDVARSRREQKRPDFQWIYLDRYEPDPTRSSKQFVVECKRLGKSSRADWVLNLNYTNHGIARFRELEWAYGQRFPSGAMVGYWQNMDAPDVLKEVNAACGKSSIAGLALVGDWKAHDTSRLEHAFERAFPVSPFKLYHLWVDVRA